MPTSKLSAVLLPFFRYYGAKHSIAKKYPPPKYGTIIEPFAGSAAYSTLYASSQVILYDLDPVIYGVWSYLIKSTAADIYKLPGYVPHEQPIYDLKVCEEARWLIGFWRGSGHYEPKLGVVKSKWKKKRPNSYWGSMVRARIANNVSRIKHWKIENKSYEGIPQSHATWFIDPPYQRSGKVYNFSQVDYGHLETWSQTREGLIICCGQVGDTWAPFDRSITIRNLGMKIVPEVMYTRDNG